MKSPVSATVPILFGVTANGTTHSDRAIPDIRTKVQMVKEAGVFDYIDRSPPDEEFRDLLKASEAYDLPVLGSGWFYRAGQDEDLFERNIIKARILGSLVHNVQLLTQHADGHALSNSEVAETYLRFYDFGNRHDVAVCFEVHVNMWSEHFGRVAQVAALVEQRGVEFDMTLDHSHVIFKIDNAAEQDVQGMRADIEAGQVILEPGRASNVCQQWIDAGYVRHAHARAAVPNNPINSCASHPDGRYGRGIQYPLAEPGAYELHHDWEQERLEPWKAVVRNLLRWHALNPPSKLRTISCEFIPFVDYGAGVGYSIFDQNIACARWLRSEWDAVLRDLTEQCPAEQAQVTSR